MRLAATGGAVILGLASAAADPLPLVEQTPFPAESAPAYWRLGDPAPDAKAALSGVTLPPGFEIELFAVAPGVRRLAVSGSGRAVFAQAAEPGLAAFPDADRDERAEAALRLSAASAFPAPLAPCVAPDGGVFGVAGSETYFLPAAEYALTDPNLRAHLLPSAGAPLASAAGPAGPATSCAVSYDGQLHVAFAADAQSPGARGGVVRMTAYGEKREQIAALDAPEHLKLNPADGRLWAGGRVAIGPLSPPDAEDAEDENAPDAAPAPTQKLMQLSARVRAAPEEELAGFGFVPSTQFPDEFVGALIYASRQDAGAWRLMLQRDADAAPEPFAQGWPEQGGPVDIAFLRDGSMLLADPVVGAVYRVSWGAIEILGPETTLQPDTQPDAQTDAQTDAPLMIELGPESATPLSE